MVITFTQQGPQIDMQIVEFTTEQDKHGRHGSPAIPAGTKLYAVAYLPQYARNVTYFHYSYMDRKDAEHVIYVSRRDKTNTEFYRQWNHVDDIQNTMHVWSRKR